MNNKKDKQSGGAIQKMLGGMDITTISIISLVSLVVLIVILWYTNVIDFSFITNLFSSTEKIVSETRVNNQGTTVSTTATGSGSVAGLFPPTPK